MPHPPRLPLPIVLANIEPLIVERRYNEALTALETTGQNYPDSSLPFIKMGQIYLRQQRWFLAEDAFNRALARDLGNPWALTGLAQTLFNQGRLTDSWQVWQTLVSTRPQFPGGFTGLGMTELSLFEFEAARAAFEEQQQHQFDPQAQWYLAALTAPYDRQTAVDQLQAISIEANNSELSADILAQQDYLLEALTQSSPSASPAEVAKATGIALAQVEQWPLAVYALTAARQQGDQPDAETLAFLAYAQAKAGRPAMELFAQAHQTDPNSALPMFFEGLYLREQGALRAAAASLQQALELDPDNAATYVELARTKAQQGDLGTAESLYQAAVEIAPGDPRFHKLLVEFYANRSYRAAEAGLPAAETLLKLDETDAEAQALLGRLQLLAGNPAAGEVSLRQALELQPDLISARYFLARLLEGQGQLETARAEYQRVVDWDSSGQFRKLALQGLQRLDKP